jgi:hypothetical protein
MFGFGDHFDLCRAYDRYFHLVPPSKIGSKLNLPAVNRRFGGGNQGEISRFFLENVRQKCTTSPSFYWEEHLQFWAKNARMNQNEAKMVPLL